MANIPKAREYLVDALEYNMDHRVRIAIESALQEMYREYTKPKAPITSNKITASLGKTIIAYAKTHPTASCQQIGVKFNVNSGRVSELLSGKHDYF